MSRRQFTDVGSVDNLYYWFSYDATLGSLTWFRESSRRCPVGTIVEATRVGIPGVGVRQTSYVIWKMMTGENVPVDKVVDHRNRNRWDWRWSNLRLATFGQNNFNCDQKNRRSEPGSTTPGVRILSSPHRPLRCYAWIKQNGKIAERSRVFSTIEEAVVARRQLEVKYGYAEFTPE